MNDPHVIVAFLTGQSDSRENALSPVQRRFLERSPVPAGSWLDLNFPYRPCGGWREAHLIRASLNNTRQYLASRRPAFAARHRTAFLETFGGSGPVILLAGSCGLELLVNLRLPAEFLRRLHVFAYGPVSRSVPACASLRLIQGNRDAISRWWHPAADHVIPCGHMDYLETAEMSELFSAFYHEVTKGGGTHAED